VFTPPPTPNHGNNGNNKPWPVSPWGLALILLTVLWVRDLWVNNAQVQPIPYSEFVQHLQSGDVASVRIGSNTIEGELKKPLPDGRQRFITTRVEPELAKDMASHNVRF